MIENKKECDPKDFDSDKFDPKEEIKNPTWEDNIVHFFTCNQRKSMIWFCDLKKYEDVSKYSSKIYERVITPQAEHGMPPPPPKDISYEKNDHKEWSLAKKDTFRNWMKNGTPKGTKKDATDLT